MLYSPAYFAYESVCCPILLAQILAFWFIDYFIDGWSGCVNLWCLCHDSLFPGFMHSSCQLCY